MEDYTNQRVNCIIDNIIKNYNNKKIVLWGKCKISDTIKRKLHALYNIDVSFYVDNSLSKQNNIDVFVPTVLRNGASEYYVVVPFSNQETIVKTLELYGYTKAIDYFYLGDISASIVTQTENYYEDSLGNKIYGYYQGIDIEFAGVNSTVILGDNFRGEKSFYLQIRDNSVIEFGDNCVVNCEMLIYDQCEIRIGNCCNISTGSLLVMNGKLFIGKNFTVGKDFNIRVLPHTYMQIGDDCMFSYDIKIRTNDGHSIFDVETGRNINDTKEISQTRNIVIGDHVWLSMGVCVLYNSQVGGGTIIGANSLVKGEIPNNCIAVGTPARIIRKNVAWSRKKGTENIEDCGFEYVNYTTES